MTIERCGLGIPSGRRTGDVTQYIEGLGRYCPFLPAGSAKSDTVSTDQKAGHKSSHRVDGGSSGKTSGGRKAEPVGPGLGKTTENGELLLTWANRSEPGATEAKPLRSRSMKNNPDVPRLHSGTSLKIPDAKTTNLDALMGPLVEKLIEDQLAPLNLQKQLIQLAKPYAGEHLRFELEQDAEAIEKSIRQVESYRMYARYLRSKGLSRHPEQLQAELEKLFSYFFPEASSRLPELSECVEKTRPVFNEASLVGGRAEMFRMLEQRSQIHVLLARLNFRHQGSDTFHRSLDELRDMSESLIGTRMDETREQAKQMCREINVLSREYLQGGKS